MRQNNVKIIGITGGVGCGKSAVLDFLSKQYNAYIMQTDLIAHTLQMPGEICYQKIIDAFGSQILDNNGIINRMYLGSIVFGDEDKLKLLNSIVHPEVTNYLKKELLEIKNNNEAQHNDDKYKLVAIESALLFEAEIDSLCDETWYIYTSKENRCKRLQEIRGYSLDRINKIMQSQLDEARFFAKVNCVIDNNSDLESTYKQIREELS